MKKEILKKKTQKKLHLSRETIKALELADSSLELIAGGVSSRTRCLNSVCFC